MLISWSFVQEVVRELCWRWCPAAAGVRLEVRFFWMEPLWHWVCSSVAVATSATAQTCCQAFLSSRPCTTAPTCPLDHKYSIAWLFRNLSLKWFQIWDMEGLPFLKPMLHILLHYTDVRVLLGSTVCLFMDVSYNISKKVWFKKGLFSTVQNCFFWLAIKN